MRVLAVTTLLRHLRWQDAVDVSLLTLLFSWAYERLRRTFAVQVASGVITLIATSWIASHLGLMLTSYLLSAVSAVVTACGSSRTKSTPSPRYADSGSSAA